jgi:alkylhydroperoxidase/carboxymuconolactone decarboxylase family protein YurZ
MEKPEGLPPAAAGIAREHPAVWRAYSALGQATAEAGPLDGATLRLVKLALAIGASREGAVHSHTRRALAEGISREALVHVALLAIPTLGLSQAVQASTWIRDITDPKPPPAE